MRDRARRAIEGAVDPSVLGKFLAAIAFGFGVGIALRTEPTTVPFVGPVASPFVGAGILAAGALVIYIVTEVGGW